jgi:cellulose biosynthesis protein BcsQ
MDRGQIITFYSYKGGVGRSMMLANVAWLLASNGFRVLAVDWDFEAPGLSSYFRPFLDGRMLATTEGLLDLFVDHVDRSKSLFPLMGDVPPQPPRIDLSRHVVPVAWTFPSAGRLDLLPSGKPGPAYDRRAAGFDWVHFYERCRGHDFIESLKTSFRTTYDYILVDSRTGIGDTSGICTVQIPDTLVVCFTFSRQSIEGAARIMEAVETQREHLPIAGAPLRIFPVPTRVEAVERDMLESARQRVAATFGKFLRHLPVGDSSGYWNDVEVPYVPFYGYHEILCAFGDRPGSPLSILASTERICRYLTDRHELLAPELLDRTRAQVLEAFTQAIEVKPLESSCFISYSGKDAAFAEKLHGDLQQAGVRCWFAPHDMPIGAKMRVEIDRAIRDHDRVVLILSEDALSSSWVEKEVEAAFGRETITGRTLLLPVRLDAAIMKAELGWAADVRRQRSIGDFTAWQDRLTYQAQLERLLQSLSS